MNVVKIYVGWVLRQALKLHEKNVSFSVYWHKLYTVYTHTHTHTRTHTHTHTHIYIYIYIYT